MNREEFEQSSKFWENIKGWVCTTCQRYYGNDTEALRLSRYCCTQRGMCSCGEVSEKDRIHCAKCGEAYRAAAELRQFDKATKILAKDYDGYVFCDGLGDGIFASVSEFIDAWQEQHGYPPDDPDAEPLPNYVHGCKAETFVNLDFEHLMEQIGEESDDTWSGMMVGTDELKTALDKFNEQNKDTKVYYPVFTTVILLQDEKINQAIKKS